MNMTKTLLLAAVLASATTVRGAEHEHPTAKVSAEFERLKQLVGTWERTSHEAGAPPSRVTYELTSGGTALVEKLMPGTPMEMITVYANQGSQVNVTHFCMMGNQPELRLKKAEGDVFQFDMDGTHGLSDKNESHMHALTLTLHGDHLKHEWTSYKDDKKGEVMVFEFTKQH